MISKPSGPCCKKNQTQYIGGKSSVLNQFRKYHYFFCEDCSYRFQSNPNRNFKDIYSEAYYRGFGADTAVDYAFELENPKKTIRNLEFKGILNLVENYAKAYTDDTSKQKPLEWLDFGCGNGAFIRYVELHSNHRVSGCDIGFAAEQGKCAGTNIVSPYELLPQTFDVITAIEVLEHLDTPTETLEYIYKLLKPGGFFFYTTGNSRPFAKNFLSWSYTKATDVHIGFFEPKTIEKLFASIGFSIISHDDYRNWGLIYKYKILKNLGVKKVTALLYFMIPNSIRITKILDSKFGLMALPAGVRPSEKLDN